MTKARVAVVGGGIFGVTAAVELARRGHSVDLYEREPDLLAAASGINQYRVHRGYHYPRSLSTAMSSRDSELSFRTAYAAAVIDDYEHFYAIAKRDTLTTADEFIRFMEAAELEYERADVPFLSPEPLELVVKVRESLFDPAALRQISWQRLKQVGVRVHLGIEARHSDFDSHDYVVVATYASLNHVLEGLPELRNYQFEVCEKPVVRPPAALAGRSVVVLDGPFMCIDPLGRTGLSVMGNVVHAIHRVSVGQRPDIPEDIKPLLNRGVVPKPSVTKYAQFVEAAKEFMPDIRDAEHVGSMYTIRTVLPGVDKTDERPTLVARLDERVITMFSGKIGTCVRAADSLVEIIEGDAQKQHPVPPSRRALAAE